jgi:hypothetical protein
MRYERGLVRIDVNVHMPTLATTDPAPARPWALAIWEI